MLSDKLESISYRDILPKKGEFSDTDLLFAMLGDIAYPTEAREALREERVACYLDMGYSIESMGDMVERDVERRMKELAYVPYVGRLRAEAYRMYADYLRTNGDSGLKLSRFLRRADGLRRRMYEFAKMYLGIDFIKLEQPFDVERVMGQFGDILRRSKSQVNKLGGIDEQISIGLKIDPDRRGTKKSLGADSKITVFVNREGRVCELKIFERLWANSCKDRGEYDDIPGGWRADLGMSVMSHLILLGQNYPACEDMANYKVEGRGQDFVIYSGPMKIKGHVHDGGSDWGTVFDWEKRVFVTGDDEQEALEIVRRYLELVRDIPREATGKL